MPIGFSKASSEAKQGLPIGAAMISKPQRLLEMLKIANFFNKKKKGNGDVNSRFVKLPHTTPNLYNYYFVNTATTFKVIPVIRNCFSYGVSFFLMRVVIKRF